MKLNLKAFTWIEDGERVWLEPKEDDRCIYLFKVKRSNVVNANVYMECILDFWQKSKEHTLKELAKRAYEAWGVQILDDNENLKVA